MFFIAHRELLVGEKQWQKVHEMIPEWLGYARYSLEKQLGWYRGFFAPSERAAFLLLEER